MRKIAGPHPPAAYIGAGEVPERFNGAVSKTVDLSRGPGVRIPPSPLCVRRRGRITRIQRLLENGDCRTSQLLMNPEDTTPEREVPALIGDRLLLYQALDRVGPELGRVYQGAIAVLADAENQVRLQLAAHALRELMDLLSKYRDVPVDASKERMGDKVRTLDDRWGALSDQDYLEEGATITPRLAKFLKLTREFFVWFKEHRPRRRGVVAGALLKMDKHPLPAPPQIQKLNVNEWFEMHRYFVSSAHRFDVRLNPLEFESYLSTFERFLMNRLVPRIMPELEKIDQILRSKTSDANN